MGHGRLVVGRLSRVGPGKCFQGETTLAEDDGQGGWDEGLGLGLANLSHEVKSLGLEPQPEGIPRYGQL